MSYNVKGDMEVLRYATSKGKNLATTVGGYAAPVGSNVIEINAYSKEEMEERIGVLPISKYGTSDYLPAGVSGSFEGASTNPNQKARTLLLENNGDLVMLRNGTNGSTRNVFYAYLPNAINTTNLTGFVNTNKIYKPAYFNNQYTAIHNIQSDSNLVFLIGEKISDRVDVYMLSLTTGTLDDTVHRGVIIPKSEVTVGSPVFAMMGNTLIYIFALEIISNQTRMHVYTIPINDVENEIPSPVLTKVTGWTTTSFYGDVFTNQDYIMIYNVMTSSDPIDKPYMLYDTDVYSQFLTGLTDYFMAQDESTGLIRLKTTNDTWSSLASGSAIRPKSQFTMLLDPTNKVVQVENVQTGTPLVITSTGTSLVPSGWALINQTVYGHFVNTQSSYCISVKSGLSFIHKSGTTARDVNNIFRAYFSGSSSPVSVFDSLDISKYIYLNDPLSIGTVHNTFASSVGAALKNIELLPNNNCRLFSIDSASISRNARSAYIPPADYTFNTYDGTTYLGFEPSADRTFLPNENKIFISTVNLNQSVTTNGGILTEWRLSQDLNFDQYGNVVGTDSISISNSILQDLKNTMLSGVPNLSPGFTARIALFVPRQSNIPVFAAVQSMHPNQVGYVRIHEIAVNTRIGEITSASVGNFVTEFDIFGGITNIANGDNHTLSGMNIYEGTDFYGITLTFPYFTGIVGNSVTWTATTKVIKSTAHLSNFTYRYRLYPYTDANNYPCAIPNYGFGVLRGDLNSASAFTRLYFSTYGTTQADFDAWTAKPVNPIIVVSQDMPQGFIVYFTQNTPVLLSGKSFVLPISNIDLRTIKADPSNSTFHVYVRLEEGLAKYHITEEVIAETGTSAYTLFWIGTISTNDFQISNINIDKRARLDIFGASLEAAGASFPISYGLPSQTGTINW